MDEVQKEVSPKRTRRVTAVPATDAPAEAKKPARSRKSEDAAPAVSAPETKSSEAAAPERSNNNRNRNRSSAPAESAPKAESSSEAPTERPARDREFDGERPERTERNDLQGGLVLGELRDGDGDLQPGKKLAQARNGNLPQEDDERSDQMDPGDRRSLMPRADQHQDHCGDHDLVGDGIEELAKLRHGALCPRKITVKIIGHAHQAVERKAQRVAKLPARIP